MDLVGRNAERAFLLARLGAAAAGRGSVMVVRGPGGIGKTVLLQDLAAQAADVRVLRAMGVEFEADLRRSPPSPSSPGRCSAVSVVPFTTPHDSEVIGEFRATGGVRYPGEPAIAEQAQVTCSAFFA